MKVNVVWHPSSLRHHTGTGHPENPERLRAVLETLRSQELASSVVWHEAAPANREHILEVHSLQYVQRLEQLAEQGGGWLDGDTVMSADSFDAALHAAGAAIKAVELGHGGENAFAAVRPPGHHACRTRAMGFCLLNNIVIAARFALNNYDLSRVLIVDWDVHHGNGTQELVESDERVRYVSLHEWPLYPGTGATEERGVGNIFNVPRPGGLPRATYVEDLSRAVDSATRSWNPDLLLISAGFDAMAGDPLAHFTLEPEDYAEWVSRWLRFGVPIVSVLEGGYVPERVAAGVVAHLWSRGKAGSPGFHFGPEHAVDSRQL